MTRYGTRENGHVPAHLALREIQADVCERSMPPLLEMLDAMAAEDGVAWESTDAGVFPWMFADRDGKVPNAWAGPLRPPEGA